jgi:hypothetical protein
MLERLAKRAEMLFYTGSPTAMWKIIETTHIRARWKAVVASLCL